MSQAARPRSLSALASPSASVPAPLSASSQAPHRDAGVHERFAASALRFLHRPIVFQEPERAVAPSSWLDYTPFAFWMIEALRPSVFVELGCHTGNSYASFAQAVQTLGLPTTCYAVDTWRGDPHAGFFDEEIFEEWSAYHDRRFAAFSRLVRSTFDEAAEHFADGSIDLLHLDGYHTFESVSHDFEVWRPKLSARGVMLCHDIDVRERDFGAWRLWDRLKEEYPSFEFRHGHGLGVLGIGTELPEPVRWLLSLRTQDPERAAIVRQFFARLGAAVLNGFHATEAARALRRERAVRAGDVVAGSAADAAKSFPSPPAPSPQGEGEDGDHRRAASGEPLAAAAPHAAGAAQAGDAAQPGSAVQAGSDSQTASALQAAEERERLLSEIASLQGRVRVLSATVDERDAKVERVTHRLGRVRSALEEAGHREAAARAHVRHMTDAVESAQRAVSTQAADTRRLASELRTRDERIADLERDREADAQARAAADVIARRLDEEAADLLERLQREALALDEERTRRRELEARLVWTQAQVEALCKERAPDANTVARAASTLPSTVTSAGRSAAEATTREASRTESPSTSSLAQERSSTRLSSASASGSASTPADAASARRETHAAAAAAEENAVRTAEVIETSTELSHGGIGRSFTRGLATALRVVGGGSSPPRPSADRTPATRTPAMRTAATDPASAERERGASAARAAEPRESAATAHDAIDAAHNRDRQRIEQSGLFDAAWYLAQLPDPAAAERDPLAHYLRDGWRTGRSPHPLFDPAYYLAQGPDVARWGGDPLVHYLAYGAGERRSPHPLFDADFYLHTYPDALSDRTAPLVDFLRHSARTSHTPGTSGESRSSGEPRNPSAFFDAAYYLETNPDVAATGLNPLIHFVQFGWREGRNPSASFDIADYLARYADVRESGENPLIHYVRFGRAHGRQARPQLRGMTLTPRRGAAAARVAISAQPLAPASDTRPTILLLSHVGTARPRAGNEYRVERMLRWYRARGYRVVPVIAPLPGEELATADVEALADAYGNAVQVHRDGRVEHILRDLPDVIAPLDGTFTPSFADILGESGASPQERELLKLERTFCHDAVIATVLQLQRTLGPHILQVEYIWMTRLLPLVRGPVLKVVDTHDVFSSIEHKVRMFGVRDVVISSHQEAERLRRADLVIAIQDDERAELTRLASSVPAITAGVDFDILDDASTGPAAVASASSARQLLFVASNNARNRKGLEDFLRFAWPRIQERTPRAELVVVGSVARALDGRDLPGVRPVGFVDDLTAMYRSAALVINPVVAGTGLKIKILEALCHLRPVVTWPAGIDGLDAALASCCLVARDWYEFSERVTGLLKQAPAEGFTPAVRALIAERLQPARVYAALDEAYRDFFERTRPWSAAARSALPAECAPRHSTSAAREVIHARD